MEKNDNIYVKLQIEKDSHSGGLALGIYFDKNAPNFTIEKNGMNWCPTEEELEFILETYDLVSSKGGKNFNHNFKTKHHPTSSYEDDDKYEHQENKEELNNLEVEHITSSSTDHKENIFPDKGEERIFVQANDELIDEALKRQKAEQDSQLTTQSDDKIIIDRVLRDRIKKKN